MEVELGHRLTLCLPLQHLPHPYPPIGHCPISNQETPLHGHPRHCSIPTRSETTVTTTTTMHQCHRHIHHRPLWLVGKDNSASCWHFY